MRSGSKSASRRFFRLQLEHDDDDDDDGFELFVRGAFRHTSTSSSGAVLDTSWFTKSPKTKSFSS